MLHIKDIEAFARINEALARDSDAPREDAPQGDAGADASHPPAHPALLLAMVATGRLKPPAEDGEEPAPAAPTTLAGMMARMWMPRGR